MNLIPPPMPEAALIPRAESPAPAPVGSMNRLWRIAAAILGWAWRWLVGAVMCFNFFGLSWLTSIVAVGWTNRVVQMMVLRCWWWRSEQRRLKSFAEFCQTLGEDAPDPRPRWFVQNGLRASLNQPRRGGRPKTFLTRCGRVLIWPWQSLWLNFWLGVKATLCTYALTGLPCLLMLWSWEQGWINSFHGGYELAWFGPTMGFLGIFVFVGVMFYVPMAQAHQAVTGSYDQILWIAG